MTQCSIYYTLHDSITSSHLTASFPNSKQVFKSSHLNVSCIDLHESTSFVCVGFIPVCLLHLLNRRAPRRGKQIHHRCTISDEILKMPACSVASLILRYLAWYCQSIIYSLQWFLRVYHVFSCDSAVLLLLSSVTT